MPYGVDTDQISTVYPIVSRESCLAEYVWYMWYEHRDYETEENVCAHVASTLVQTDEGLVGARGITKTRLFKYIEHFTTKN